MELYLDKIENRTLDHLQIQRPVFSLLFFIRYIDYPFALFLGIL